MDTQSRQQNGSKVGWEWHLTVATKINQITQLSIHSTYTKLAALSQQKGKRQQNQNDKSTKGTRDRADSSCFVLQKSDHSRPTFRYLIGVFSSHWTWDKVVFSLWPLSWRGARLNEKVVGACFFLSEKALEATAHQQVCRHCKLIIVLKDFFKTALLIIWASVTKSSRVICVCVILP